MDRSLDPPMRTLSVDPNSINNSCSNETQVCGFDWDENVVSFISTCSHPGLVRRTSSAANRQNSSNKPFFSKKHRRNLSLATNVSFGGDNHYHPRDSYAMSYYSHPNRNLGHSRNISDPSACFWTSGNPNVQSPCYLPGWGWPNLNMTSPVPFAINHGYYPPVVISDQNNAEFLKRSSNLLGIPKKSHEQYLDETEESIKPKLEPSRVLSKQERCLIPCLQFCISPFTVLISLCMVMFMQSLVLSGLMSSIFTTLERRFNLSSSQIGYLISCSELAGMLTTVAVSFWIRGDKHNRLRLIGWFCLILALGFGLFAVPHFLTGPYNPIQQQHQQQRSQKQKGFDYLNEEKSQILIEGPYCLLNYGNRSQTLIDEIINNDGYDVNIDDGNEKNEKEEDCGGGIDEKLGSVLFGLFCISMFLIGIGGSPSYVLGPTFLWDNLTNKQYPIYAGRFMIYDLIIFYLFNKII